MELWSSEAPFNIDLYWSVQLNFLSGGGCDPKSCAHLFILFSSCKAHHEQHLHWVSQEYRTHIHKAEIHLGHFHKYKHGSHAQRSLCVSFSVGVRQTPCTCRGHQRALVLFSNNLWPHGALALIYCPLTKPADYRPLSFSFCLRPPLAKSFISWGIQKL